MDPGPDSYLYLQRKQSHNRRPQLFVNFYIYYNKNYDMFICAFFNITLGM